MIKVTELAIEGGTTLVVKGERDTVIMEVFNNLRSYATFDAVNMFRLPGVPDTFLVTVVLSKVILVGPDRDWDENAAVAPNVVSEVGSKAEVTL